jgi:hypothetical protein
VSAFVLIEVGRIAPDHYTCSGHGAAQPLPRPSEFLVEARNVIPLCIWPRGLQVCISIRLWKRFSALGKVLSFRLRQAYCLPASFRTLFPDRHHGQAASCFKVHKKGFATAAHLCRKSPAPPKKDTFPAVIALLDHVVPERR